VLQALAILTSERTMKKILVVTLALAITPLVVFDLATEKKS
jgi:hypothetical protein